MKAKVTVEIDPTTEGKEIEYIYKISGYETRCIADDMVLETKAIRNDVVRVAWKGIRTNFEYNPKDLSIKLTNVRKEGKPMLKIVEFEGWCNKCKYGTTSEDESPCKDCLAVPAREDSRKPEKYEYKGTTSKKEK